MKKMLAFILVVVLCASCGGKDGSSEGETLSHSKLYRLYVIGAEAKVGRVQEEVKRLHQAYLQKFESVSFDTSVENKVIVSQYYGMEGDILYLLYDQVKLRLYSADLEEVRRFVENQP